MTEETVKILHGLKKPFTVTEELHADFIETYHFSRLKNITSI